MKPKVIILYNRIFHYRIPIWNLLAQKCELTVAYSEGKCKIPEDLECNFAVMYLPAKVYFNRFVIQKDNIRELVKKFDVAVVYGDIAWLKYSTLPWFNKSKIVFHSLGVSASYNKKYDSHREWDVVRKFFYSKANALAFYTPFPIGKYERLGIPREKMFEAPNTVEVRPLDTSIERDSILFIGTLYRQKGLQLVLDAYLALRHFPNLPKFRIIGKGPEFDSIVEWIAYHKMDDLIEMKGAIYDINEKAKYFAQALVCISPNQAGLSVLESMGYGVPFVTMKNAITGGEIFNIHDGIDGVIIDDNNQIATVIADISQNRNKYLEMGKAAQRFYNEYRTPQCMADGLWEAIEYAFYH